MASKHNKSAPKSQDNNSRARKEIHKFRADGGHEHEEVWPSGEDVEGEGDEAAGGAGGWSPPIDEDVRLRWLAQRLDLRRLAALDFIDARPLIDGYVQLERLDGSVEPFRPSELYVDFTRGIHDLLLAQLYARERLCEPGTARTVQCALTAWEFCLEDLKRNETPVSGRAS